MEIKCFFLSHYCFNWLGIVSLGFSGLCKFVYTKTEYNLSALECYKVFSGLPLNLIIQGGHPERITIWLVKPTFHLQHWCELPQIVIYKIKLHSLLYDHAPPIGHVGLTFHTFNGKWWLIIFLLVLKQKLQFWCRSKCNLLSKSLNIFLTAFK